jgi:hypothetical protein
MICVAYLPSPLDDEARARVLAFHSFAVVKVIKRHLNLGFTLQGIELRNEHGYRNDVVFVRPDGLLRTVEVKSGKQLTEVHRIQAALYWSPEAGEIAVSNGNVDTVLTPEYIASVQEKAQAVRQILIERPDIAAIQFNPASDVCRICSNNSCPFLPEQQTKLIRK